jgi:glutamyl-Q tRNA(Asp) synthetase
MPPIAPGPACRAARRRHSAGMARSPTEAGSARPVFRFAPSPNGRLHLGHAYSALLNRHLADRCGGRFLIRMEDIDPGRSRAEHAEAILDDLAWLRLVSEGPVRVQSRHLADYIAAADRLRAEGLLYPCFCSRSEIIAAAGPHPDRGPDGAILYPGTCRGLVPHEIERRRAAGLRPAWRLDMARARAVAGPLTWPRWEPGGSDPAGWGLIRVEADPGRWGDLVIVRRDTPTSYHLSVVVDDAAQGVTHVVRGQDLEPATEVHRLLQALLGFPVPCYHHHALVTDEAGTKLAKSAGSPALAALRSAGETPNSIRARFGLP